MAKVKLIHEPFMYKNIRLELIRRGYSKDSKAKRFTLNGTNQNVWIPNKHLYDDGTLKEDQDIDYVFLKSVRQLAISGINHIGYLYDDHFKLIIAGGRDFDNYSLLKKKCDRILSRLTKPITVISGTASGADKLGERYAKEKGYNLVLMPADWKDPEKKKSAGYIRNKDMASVANACICFWDGKSRGTKHMIDIAKDVSLQLRIVKY